MSRIVKRWPVASVLIVLHAIVVLTTATWFYTSHDPERLWIWVYAIIASYPSSALVRFLAHGSEAAFAAALLLLGTFQWGIVGVVIDAIIHYFRREATPNI
jgi:hypothetical protein